jgi:hypothetical protein
LLWYLSKATAGLFATACCSSHFGCSTGFHFARKPWSRFIQFAPKKFFRVSGGTFMFSWGHIGDNGMTCGALVFDASKQSLGVVAAIQAQGLCCRSHVVALDILLNFRETILDIWAGSGKICSG